MEGMEALSARLGIPVRTFETLDSTSDECRRVFAQGAERCLVIARQQTGGRGRSGKQFFSPAGGLYMSLLLPMPEDAALLTCRAAAVTAQAIETVTGISCGIKWVNDLYLHGRKVCGILAEALPGSVILGIGVNLEPSPLPPELESIVGFLGCREYREALAAEIAAGLLQAPAGDFMEEYRRRSIVIGRTVECRAGIRVFPARVLGIDDEGGLAVLSSAGRETLRFGEVAIKSGTWE